MPHSPPSPAFAVESLLSQSPNGMRPRNMVPPSCCCGRVNCAYLEYNNAALEGLEQDLRRAAHIGQALLARHEAFMAEAADERLKMSASIDRLENDKKDLEAANAKAIHANRDLLDQLEDMNNTLASSDAQILSLSAKLQSTRDELDRLAVMVGRTKQLESQLTAMESEQATLREDLMAREEGQHTAVQRWKNAERTIGYLQEQVDRMEQEASDEQQRHIEMVSRIEKRRAVEKELGTAAGRLKGAAAATTLGRDRGGSSVVSHFVKDILQDNANLQMGIVELREMLTGSNAEVENLREQMMQHQTTTDSRGLMISSTPLSAELAEVSLKDPVAEVPSELHVHHHYHPPNSAERSSKGKSPNPYRRIRKKRNVITSGIFTPPSAIQTPYTPSNGPVTRSPSSTSTLLSHTSVSIPPLNTDHPPPWTMQSPRARSSVPASSVPSSPRSAYRHSSVFDHLETPADYSRPTSPESAFLGSPVFPLKQRNRGSDLSQRSLHASASVLPRSTSSSNTAGGSQTACEPLPQRQQGLPDIDSSYFDRATIFEEPEDATFATASREVHEAPIADSPTQQYRPTLRRSASHESILSRKESPFPTLHNQYSQLLCPPLKACSSLSITSPFIEPVINTLSASSNASMQSRGQHSRDYNRSILSGLSSHSNNDGRNETGGGPPTIGKRVGGWVWGKWGVVVAPMASDGNLRASAANRASSSGSGAQQRLRAAGVNQKGRVKGLKAPRRMASQVEVEGVDEGLLRESLGQE